MDRDMTGKRSGKADEYPTIMFEDQAAWTAWLEQNHDTARGVWLRIAKSASPLSSVTITEALDAALCYGWIDGQRKGLDEDTYLQKFTPRGARSMWSKRNREHVARLIATGAMRPAGLAAIEAAKADGRWDRAYDSPATAEVPDDFRAAMRRYPAAARFFDSLGSSQRFPFLYRIQTAVKPETRARRIAQFVDMLRRGETL
jgi:uncharacterized protein YdeI (YjbR/CyaY-like superfamily)